MTTVFILVIAAVILAGVAIPVLLYAKGKGQGSQSKTGWMLLNSRNVKLDSATGVQFTFPNQDGVHYVAKSVQGIKAKQMSMTFEITGTNPVFHSADGGTPQVHFYLESGERIWSNYEHRVELALGKATLTVPMSPESWQTINGMSCTTDPAAFTRIVSGAALAGFTFGGEHGYGHGVWMESGQARFRLISFSP